MENTAKKTSNDIASLLIPAQMGSKQAQWEIVQSFEPLVKKLLHREKDPFKQEDLRQDLYVGILEAIQRFDNEPMFFPNYLKQSLHNIMGKYARHQVQERMLEENLLAANLPMSAEPEYPGLEESHFRSRKERAAAALQQLTPEELHLISCRMGSRPMKWQEIARATGMNRNTAAWKYNEILRKVRAEVHRKEPAASPQNA